MRLTRLLVHGLYVYLFSANCSMPSFEACKFGRVQHYTRGRQLRLKSGGDTERTLFVCTIGGGMYVGTFLDFFTFRFPSSINDAGEAFVEQRMLAHVTWFPKVKTITVTDRRTSAVGCISYVPLGQQSCDPEIVIDLASSLELMPATLLRVNESATRRGRFLFTGEHSHPASADPDYAHNTLHNARAHGLVHARGYIISKAHC